MGADAYNSAGCTKRGGGVVVEMREKVLQPGLGVS